MKLRAEAVDMSEQTERMQSMHHLQHDPFGALVDAMVFSGAGGRYEAAETIRHLLTYSHQDSLVLGRAGTGKRMLAQQVLKMLEDHWRVAWIDGSETDSFVDLLREIVGQLGLGLRLDADADELLQRIIEVTAARTHNDESFLIVIQFADRLPVDILAKLKLLRGSGEALESRVRQLWMCNSLDDFAAPIEEDDWYAHPLERFSDAAAEQYIKDRLIGAGNVSEVPISVKDIHRLNQMAGGLPDRLNELARDYLISATFKTSDKGRSFPLTHVMAGLAAVVLVVIAYLYNESVNEPEVVTVVPVPVQPMSAVEKKLAEAVASVEAKQQNIVPEGEPGTLLETPVALADTAVVAPEAPKPTDAAKIVEPAKAVTAPIEPQSVKVPVSVTKVAAIPAKARLLLNGAPDAFTQQLIGVRDRAMLVELATQFAAPESVDIVESIHQGKAWFILIHGQFNTKEAALQASAGLPGSFKDQTPWIRTFKSIRAEAVR
ncbi:MAG: DamX protein [Reinekea sp.]